MTDAERKAKAAMYTRKWNAKWYPILREQAYVAAGGKRCQNCGITDERVLTFDHIGGGGRTERKSTSSIQILKRIIKEPSRFRVLCMNRNWLAHKHPHSLKTVA